MNRIYKVIYILVFAIGYGNYRDANSVAVGAFCTRGRVRYSVCCFVAKAK